MNVSYALIETKLGWVGIVGSGGRLQESTLPQVSLEATIALLGDRLKGANPDAATFGDLPQRLRRYFEGERVPFPDELDLTKATTFQRASWQVVRSIPYGETRSYAWVAREIGKPKAARAVGQAMAANPFPIIVPCHRVIGTNSSLTGFGGGLPMKKQLLEMEASQSQRWVGRS